MFHGIGQHFGLAGGGGVGAHQNAAMTLASGMAGGVMASLQGGRFGHGFASAGFSAALSPTLGQIRPVPGQAVAHAVVGGTASVLAGGKFGNGAVTAAFSYSTRYAFESAAVRRYFEHYTFAPGADTPIESKFPESTAMALKKILKSPFGRRLASSLRLSDSRITLIDVPVHEAFAVRPDTNEIWYSSDLDAYKDYVWSSGASVPGDGLNTATLDVLLYHEIGHTVAGAALHAQQPISVYSTSSSRDEEFRVIRHFENPYRGHFGLPARCSYASENDYCGR